MDQFHWYWLVAVVVLGALYMFGGVRAGKGPIGALVDRRNRISLNRLQFVMWSLIILSALSATFVAAAFERTPGGDAGSSSMWAIPKVNQHLLGLVGISTASMVTAGAVKRSKETRAKMASSQVARLREAAAESGSTELQLAAAREAARPELPMIPPSMRPSFAQVFLEEEGQQAGAVVSVTKFQNLVLTLLAAIALVLMIWEKKNLSFDLDPQFLALLGASHAGYVGGKVPDKP